MTTKPHKIFMDNVVGRGIVIKGCTCGWVVPEGAGDPDDAVALHITTARLHLNKVQVVLFFDGFGGVSHVFTFTFDSDTKAIDEWAAEKIAADKAIFKKNPNNKSLAQHHVTYGSTAEAIYLSSSPAHYTRSTVYLAAGPACPRCRAAPCGCGGPTR